MDLDYILLILSAIGVWYYLTSDKISTTFSAPIDPYASTRPSWAPPNSIPYTAMGIPAWDGMGSAWHV